MSAAIEIAQNATDNIEQLLTEMLEGNYADNEISLGVLLNGKEEIQVQLKITRSPDDFIDTEYADWDESHKPLTSE